MTFEEVKPQIEEILNNDNLYDALRDARAEIDDAVNGGKDLAETGKMFGIEPVRISGISETAPVENAPAQLKSLTTSLDFNELVFSYGLNEISSAEEFDDGIVVIQVTAIKEAHLPEIDEVKDKITAMWEVQEKMRWLRKLPTTSLPMPKTANSSPMRRKHGIWKFSVPNQSTVMKHLPV